MSPAGRADRSGRADGFTLIEMVCVMAIIAMLGSLALPMAMRGTSTLRLEQLSMRVAALLEADRYAAIRDRVTIATTLDMRTKVIQSSVSRREVAIPADVTARATTSQECQTRSASATILFYADGRSCGGTLALIGAGAGFEIRVNWLTGGVEIVSVPRS